MANHSPRILFVVPTRNRPELAENAIRSLVQQPASHPSHSILVSDNSTEAGDVRKLHRFCTQFSQNMVRYVRPPEPLPMPTHFNWAMHHGLSSTEFTHFACLTDRMIFRSGQLATLTDIIAAYPQAVVSYGHDRIVDNIRPVRLEQQDWTGDLFEISASHLLYLISQGVLHQSLPRVLNCVAPRSVLNSIKDRFGSICGSTAPDFSFCFRCLEQAESILYYDKPLLVHYALARSNGASFAIGRASPDSRDFLRNLPSTGLNFAAPYPEVWTTDNTIFHEYCVARNETRSSKFPPLDMERYTSHLEWEVARIENWRVRRQMRARLRARRDVKNPSAQEKSPLSLSLVHPAKSIDSLALALKQRYWAFLKRRRDPRETRATPRPCEFRSVSDALRYASQSFRPPSTDSAGTTALLAPNFNPRFLRQPRLSLGSAIQVVMRQDPGRMND